MTIHRLSRHLIVDRHLSLRRASRAASLCPERHSRPTQNLKTDLSLNLRETAHSATLHAPSLAHPLSLRQPSKLQTSSPQITV